MPTIERPEGAELPELETREGPGVKDDGPYHEAPPFPPVVRSEERPRKGAGLWPWLILGGLVAAARKRKGRR